MDKIKKINKSLDEAAREIVIKMHPCLKDCTILEDRLTRGQLMALVKAGAEWQYQKDRGEFAKIKAKTWCEGFDAHKEQMLKNAVEGYVNYYEDSGGILIAEAQVGCPYHTGDKVRIVVLKAEEE